MIWLAIIQVFILGMEIAIHRSRPTELNYWATLIVGIAFGFTWALWIAQRSLR